MIPVRMWMTYIYYAVNHYVFCIDTNGALFVNVLQLFSNFKKFNEVHKSYNGNLPESEILEIVDGVCNNKDTFNT